MVSLPLGKEDLAKWREWNPFYDHCVQQERDLKLPFMSLQERQRIEARAAAADALDDDDD